MEEIWKDIAGYENLYQIGSDGSIKMVRETLQRKTDRKPRPNPYYGKIMRCKLNGAGYLSTCFTKDGVTKMVSPHRLVAEAFIPNPENKRTVNHKNGIKTDNRLENLEWATSSEQNIHGFKTGLRVAPNKKFTPEQVVEVRSKFKAGNRTRRSLAEEYNVCGTTISRIVDNKIYQTP
jgi:hypothetical protein